MSGNEFTFRKASVADAAQLKQLGVISYGGYKEVLTPDNWEKLNSFLHDEERLVELLGMATCFVCEDAGRIIGMAYIVGSGNAWDIFTNEWAYIRMVGVHPQYAGKGIARQLTRMCIKHAGENNEQIIALHTSEFMHAARHIYESLGFTVLHPIPDRLGKKYWLYTLAL